MLVAFRAHPFRELIQIALHHWLDEGVEHRGRRALVLAPLAGDRVRNGDRQIRIAHGDAVAGRDLMGRVRIGVQEGDSDRLGTARHEDIHLAIDRVEVDRREDLAAEGEPFRHFAA